MFPLFTLNHREKVMRNIVTIFLLFGLYILKAQTPFECGAAYFTASSNGSTNIYKVIKNNNNSLSSNLFVKADRDFNGVGYRRQDNLMYAIESSQNSDKTYNFLQIDGSGKTKILRTLPWNTNYSYISGDVTIDGKYYISLANGSTPNKLYLIDLLSPNYSFQELTFPAGTNIDSPDIAFSPDGTRLFAYQSSSKKLVEIDYTNATITKEYDNLSSVNGNFSGMWSYDCALYGYNRTYGGFYRIELEGKTQKIGNLTEVNTFTPSGSSSIDGCSCPPPVKFYKHAIKTINPDTCLSEIKFYFTIDNKCGIQQNDILFRDMLPKEFTIVKIDKNPFGGVIKKGIGTSELLIEKMTVPNRRDTMIITTRLKPVLDKPVFKNQAFLENIRHQDGAAITVKSDDPFTPEYLDSTIVKAPLFVKFSRDTISLCPNQGAKLQPQIEGQNLNYLWNTGEKAAQITVQKAGTYSVTVTSDCDIKIDTQVVVNAPLTLELGENQNILPGDSVLIFPSVSGYNPLKNIVWITTKGTNLRYKNQLNNSSKPSEDEVNISLLLTDDQGCTAYDNLIIRMRRNLYLPNIFTPNDDSINDNFYIFTEARAIVSIFQIFDRWGNLVFEQNNCPTNDPTCGWDGNYKNIKANEALYTYRAVVKFFDGTSIDKKGDVMLLR
jgi:gliding motility-associated-like protein